MSAAALSEGTLLAGKYRLLSRIGRGAMGEVWAAINVATDRQVAIKLISSPDPETRRRLLREARAMGRLDHPNIVQILDRGETNVGEPFLVMQLLQGETLGQRLRRERTLPEAVAAGIALDIARALRVAHAKEIVHRDLKPGNIFLHREEDTEEDIVKVVDFGVSKLTLEGDGATMTRDIVGSPAYMSPEQIRNVGVDGRTDIWALGVMLFEMLAGKRPFPGAQAAAVIGQVLTQPVPRIETAAPGVSRAMGDVIAGCMDRDLGWRIASAAELLQALRPLAPRALYASKEDSDARGRLTALPDAPQPAATSATLDAAAERQSDPATAVFRSGILPGAPALQASRSGATGTVIMSPEPPSTERESDVATGIFRPSMVQSGSHPKPSVAERESQPTSVFQPTAPKGAAERSEDLESERPTTEIVASARQPAPPRSPPPAKPLVTLGSDPTVSPRTASERGYDATMPLREAIPAPVVPARWNATLLLDPNLPPGSPAASVRVPESSKVVPQPPEPRSDPLQQRPLLEPSVQPAPTSRRPAILLGVALVAFLVIMTLLVVTLTEHDHGSPSPVESASEVTPGSAPSSAAPAIASADVDPEASISAPSPNAPTPTSAPSSRRPWGDIIRHDPWSTEPTPTATAIVVQDRPASPPPDEEATRKVLEAKMRSGRASLTDLKMLKAICSHLGDHPCRDAAARALAARQGN